MHLPRRRLAALTLAAVTPLVLGSSTLAGVGAAAAPPAAGTGPGTDPGTAGRHAYDARATGPAKAIKVDLLSINDFHGNLEVVPPASSSGRINGTPAGGVAYLASLLEQERAKSRAAGATPITVAAGDLIGA